MGYYATPNGNNITIKKENIEKALTFLYQNDYALIDDYDATIDAADVFSDVLLDNGFTVQFDGNGNVIGITQSVEINYDDDIFDIISPVVENGSFAEYYDEFGDHWRIMFVDGKTVRHNARVVFPADVVYLVTKSWSTSSSIGTEMHGVFFSKEKALESMNGLIAKERMANPYSGLPHGWIESEADDSWSLRHPDGESYYYQISIHQTTVEEA